MFQFLTSTSHLWENCEDCTEVLLYYTQLFYSHSPLNLLQSGSLYIYHSNNIAFVKVTVSINYVTSTQSLWHLSIRNSSYRSQLIEMCAGLEPQAPDRMCVCLMGASLLHHQTEKVEVSQERIQGHTGGVQVAVKDLLKRKYTLGERERESRHTQRVTSLRYLCELSYILLSLEKSRFILDYPILKKSGLFFLKFF